LALAWKLRTGQVGLKLVGILEMLYWSLLSISLSEELVVVGFAIEWGLLDKMIGNVLGDYVA
jgi:hypothetical protein